MTPMILPLLAQDPSAEGGDPAAFMRTALMMGVVFVIFWFLIVRPQRKQEEQRKTMLEGIKKKDRVVIGGGIFGVVTNVSDDELTVRIAQNPDVKVQVRRGAVAEVSISGSGGDGKK